MSDALGDYEQALLDAEEALYKAVLTAPTTAERRMLLADYEAILMYRYTRFSDVGEWEDADG